MEIKNYVSIIIPARNIEYLLIYCINKIRELYPNVEIIIVLDEINDFEKFNLDKNVKILKSTNKNMSYKRNLGVKFSKFDYVAFIDSDAYPNKNWLEISLTFLENNKNYSAVTGCQHNFPTDNISQKCLRLIRYNKLFTHKKWLKIIDTKAEEQDCSEFLTSNVIIRKSTFIELKGLDENIYLAEDNEFSNRMSDNGYKIRFIPKVNIFHREANLYAFLRKIYCMGYYYANITLNGKTFEKKRETISVFLPLLVLIIYSFIFYLFITFKINIIPLLIPPIFVLFLIIKEAYNISKNFNKNKIFSFFFTLLSSSGFIFIYTLSLFLGFIKFPSKDIKDLYKHY